MTNIINNINRYFVYSNTFNLNARGCNADKSVPVCVCDTAVCNKVRCTVLPVMTRMTKGPYVMLPHIKLGAPEIRLRGVTSCQE